MQSGKDSAGPKDKIQKSLQPDYEKTVAHTQHHDDMNSKERQIKHIEFPSPDTGDGRLGCRSSGRGIFGSNRSFLILCHLAKE